MCLLQLISSILFCQTVKSNNTNLHSSNDDYDDDYRSRRAQQSLHELQKQHQLGLIPDVEWWDAPLLQKASFNNNNNAIKDSNFPYIILEVCE